MSAAYKNMNEINGSLSVLVTGAGSVYGLGIIRSLKASVLPVEIIAIDTNPYSLGLFFADKSFIAPRAADEENYYMFIKNLCIDHQIKAIFIGSTAELPFYSRNRESLEASTRSMVFVNSPEVLELCTDKWLTMCHLSRCGFQIPATIRYPEDAGMLSSFIESAGFPLIVKPRFGRGSVGVVLAKDKEQLLESIKGKESLLIQEYITDEEQEFTVGICINQKGKVISKIALRRYLQEGVSIAAVSDSYHDITDYCAVVASTLGAYGAINIQLRLKDDKPVIFEINPRFSSSTGMRLLFGINEPESLIRSEVLCQDVIPGCASTGLVLRQYTDYYFPLDKILRPNIT
ncbi:ATP-grasp domain-containing protein [Clostridium sp. YIM B02515]|uniref:ATP-grasp domain-containing protein n=1 Tax=Clostridium rhizosphaerae TaxID=2803861 RepID=A0ABS1TAI6_9CLOT|nr:ATP-grasp domain-containing protein [Clostridium rhizosphaerae]MBL4935018.1 ATP-grasp domain-containing protein [Clostridium rhizosphaerae]